VRLALTSAPMKLCDVCLYELISSEFCNLMSHELSMQFFDQLDVSELMQLGNLVIQIGVGNLISMWMLDLFSSLREYEIYLLNVL
jgi:hypothetical protein